MHYKARVKVKDKVDKGSLPNITDKGQNQQHAAIT